VRPSKAVQDADVSTVRGQKGKSDKAACEYWCNDCGGSGEILSPAWSRDENYSCGRCSGTGHMQPTCICGTCSSWFAGKVDVELIREVERLHREGKL
jgi:DnaJ-class molecular chaperone